MGEHSLQSIPSPRRDRVPTQCPETIRPLLPVMTYARCAHHDVRTTYDDFFSRSRAALVPGRAPWAALVLTVFVPRSRAAKVPEATVLHDLVFAYEFMIFLLDHFAKQRGRNIAL